MKDQKGRIRSSQHRLELLEKRCFNCVKDCTYCQVAKEAAELRYALNGRMEQRKRA